MLMEIPKGLSSKYPQIQLLLMIEQAVSRKIAML